MSESNVETWRVVVTDGGVHEVPVERLAEEFGAESYLAAHIGALRHMAHELRTAPAEVKP